MLGATALTLLPEALRAALDLLREVSPGLLLPDLRAFVVGLVLILILILEPEGLAGRWRKIQRYWRT